MKNYLTLLAIVALTQFSYGQGTETQPKNCFEEYYKAFIERRTEPVTDGEHNIVYSARKDTVCFCGEGKLSIKDGRVVPSLMVKKTDGTYETARKVLHPKALVGETAHTHSFHVENGMTETFLTDDDYIINVFFIDFLKRKVVPNQQAPNPDDISGIQIELKPEEKEIIRKAYEGLQFENGKSVIKSTSFPTLNLMAGLLEENKDYKLNITGYTDNVGKAESNLKLSQNRAESVKTYLVKQGVEAERITTEGRGMENPIADNATAEGRAKNRRVDFVVTK